MNFRLTAFLIFILVLIAGIYYVASNHTAAPSTTTANAVFVPAPASITGITFLDGEQVKVAFTSSNGKWQMSQPVKAAVNTWEIEGIASSLKALVYKTKFLPEATGSKSLTTTGLAKPLYTILFTDAANKPYKILLGKRNASGAIYAQVDGDKTQTIYALAENPLEKLDKDVADFRSKDLIDLGSEQISALTLQTTSQKIVLTASAAGAKEKWAIQYPIPARANTPAVEEMVRSFRSLRADSFVSIGRNEPATGLAAPVLTVTALLSPKASPSPTTTPTTAPAQTLAVQFGNYSDLSKRNIYASLVGSEEVVLIAADVFDKLNKELKELRDPVILPLPVTEATRVEFIGGGGVQISKVADAWKLTSGMFKDLPAEATEVTKLLETLRDLRANKFVDAVGDLKSIGLDPPQASITLNLPGQAQPETLLLGKPETAEPLTPVKRLHEPTVYLVQSTELAKLNPTVYDLRSRSVATYTPSNISTIQISGPEAKSPLSMTKEPAPGGGFQWKTRINQTAVTLDEATISGLLADLQPLTAQKWLSQASPESQTPALELTLQVVAPSTQSVGPSLPQPVTIKLYHLADGSYLAEAPNMVTSPVWAFEPTPALVEHLTKVDYRPASATQPTTAATTATSAPATLP